MDMEKKDSIFSGLTPVPAPPPVTAPRPAVSDQEMSALKQKIEALERQAKTTPPPPPQPAAPRPPDSGQFVLARLNDLEKKLEEFSRGVMMSSTHMKNIEESRNSARRETEELLKAVREQQKYSEMDRQMHDQVEKAWGRVEDLEKKLMDFYTSAMNRPPEESRAVQTAVLSAEIEKILESKLQKLVMELELKFKSLSEKVDDTSPALARKSEEKISALVADLDVRLAAFEGEFRKLHLNISSSEDAIQSLYSEIRNEMLSALKNSMKEESAAARKYIDGFVVDTEARIDAMSKLVIGHMDELMVQTRLEGAKLEKIGAASEINVEKSRAALSAFREELEGAFRKHTADIGERIRAENVKNAGELMEFSRLSASSLAGAAAVTESMEELSGKISRLKDALTVFVDGMKDVRMESLLGVSGALVRKNLEGIRDVLSGMDQDLAVFDRIKGGITDHLKELARKKE
jgi:hypothetical protein